MADTTVTLTRCSDYSQPKIAKAITRQLENNEFIVYNPPKKQLDVTDIDTIINCIKFFKPDILINCAGYIEPSPIIETSHCRFMKHLEVNLVGAFLCSKYALINNLFKM